ncbi:universal stress protein [Streptomyces sp. NPDC057877]|uniref:universal stress protein n=1 Tax=Streptomyces sp. NPDC057877 TaxID=3346269 RepID=UPI0036C653CF
MSVPVHHRPAIVVGVDGSEASAAALRWAAAQGRALLVDVVAVHAWEPSGPRIAPYAPAAALPAPDEEQLAAAQLLAGTVRRVMGPRIGTGVRAELIQGPAARVLLHRARGAALLALGRTAHPQDGAPAAGPVSRECLRLATVPVVVVPAPVPAPLALVGASP